MTGAYSLFGTASKAIHFQNTTIMIDKFTKGRVG